jgi:uncharacterized protein YjdB
MLNRKQLFLLLGALIVSIGAFLGLSRTAMAACPPGQYCFGTITVDLFFCEREETGGEVVDCHWKVGEPDYNDECPNEDTCRTEWWDGSVRGVCSSNDAALCYRFCNLWDKSVYPHVCLEWECNLPWVFDDQCSPAYCCIAGTPPPTSTPTPVPTPTPTPCSCTLNLAPASAITDSGDTTSFSATVSDIQNGTFESVAFSSSDTSVATVSPASDTTAPYTTVATSLVEGATTISAVGYCDGVATCSDSSSLTVLPPPSCTVTTNVTPDTIDIGETSLVEAVVNVTSGTVERVDFAAEGGPFGAPSPITISPSSDSSFPYTTTATAVLDGKAAINIEVIMDGLVICSTKAALTVLAPSCTVSLTPSSANIELGDTRDFFATVAPDPPGAIIDQVNFSSSNSSVVSLSPASDDSIPYGTTATGVSLGTGESITADVVMYGVVRCSDTSSVDVINPQAWWQVWDGSVLSNGNLESRIPVGCKESPFCDELFILNGPGGFPGVPAAGSSGYGEGKVSSTLWEASTGYRSDRVFNYQTFEKMVPSDVVFNEITVDTIVDPSSLGGTVSRGYYWYHYRPSVGTTPLTIDTDLDIGTKKVVLFVEGADLDIKGTIKVDDGRGFFMAIVQGDIGVDGSLFEVSGPALEGIYVANGDFDSGAGSETLYIRGMVAAYGQVDLRRNRDDNSLTPAEVFEYAPDLVFNFPPFLARRKVVWREVVP